MSGNETATTEVPPAIDPATLRDREDVTYRERTYTHEDADHCAADAVGRVVVGVTDDAGALLATVDDEGDHAVLPNCVVDGDDEWAAVARETAARVAGTEVALEAVEAVRRVEHVLADDPEPHAVTHQVVFAASPVGEPDAGVPDDEWTAGWHASMPVDLDAGEAHGDAVADLRRFLE